MPPKKADAKKGAVEAAVAPIEGAKFIWVVCGSKDSDLKLLANINCRLDILLDYARSEFLKTIGTRIAELKALGVEPPAPPLSQNTKQGSPKQSRKQTAVTRPQSPSSPTATPVVPDANMILLEEKMNKLWSLQACLNTYSPGTLDLNEENAPTANCKANLSRCGAEVLKPSTYYFLGAYLDDDKYEPIKYSS